MCEDGDIAAAQSRYRVTSGEYSRFSKAVELPQQRARVTVDGLGNVGVGKWKKRVDSSGESGITKYKGNCQRCVPAYKMRRRIVRCRNTRLNSAQLSPTDGCVCHLSLKRKAYQTPPSGGAVRFADRGGSR